MSLSASLLDLWSIRERTNAATSWPTVAERSSMSSRGMSTVFHEDGVHPSVEAGLWVVDASKPGDELGTVLMVVEPVPGPMLDPTQQHPS